MLEFFSFDHRKVPNLPCVPWRWLCVILVVAAMGFGGGAFGQQSELPRARLLIESIQAVDGGRYRIEGEALDAQGNPACALVLASGRCAFSCGPGSQKCEGGISSLPLGSFELSGLPVEADGSIVIQVFVQGHVSHVEKRFPQPGQVAYWGVFNNVCCPAGSGTFSATIGGVTKRSQLALCTDDVAPTWEGYAPIAAGGRQPTAKYISACGNVDYPLNVNFAPGACYVLLHDTAQGAFVTLLQTECEDPS